MGRWEGRRWKQERALEGNLQEERGTASGGSSWITSSFPSLSLSLVKRAGRAFWKWRNVFRFVRRRDETVTCVRMCVRVLTSSLLAETLWLIWFTVFFLIKKEQEVHWDVLKSRVVHRCPFCFVLFCFVFNSSHVSASRRQQKSEGSLQTHSQIRGFSCDLSGVSRLALLRRRCAIQRHFLYEQFASESCDGIGRNNMKRKKNNCYCFVVGFI